MIEAPERGDAATEADVPTGPSAPGLRAAAVATLSVIAAAITVGGIFAGVSPRVHAVLAGVVGIGAAALLARSSQGIAPQVAVAVAVALTGAAAIVAGGDSPLRIAEAVREAAASGDLLRPPVAFTEGWRALLAWVMAGVGFAAGWAALGLRRPAMALLLPVPVIGFGAISVPSAQQVGTGIAAFGGIALGMSVLSGIDRGSDPGARTFEARRLVRSAAVVVAMSVALGALSVADVLFPEPLLDPTLEPQKPKAIPLSEVEDRVLFRVESSVSGPWRMGLLDVYDGTDWRLPPFAESDLVEIPSSGIIDDELQPGLKATFTTAGLRGGVLPGLPNLVGLVARGDLAFDARTGNIRVTQGEVSEGITYTVTSARLPSVEELRAIEQPVPEDVTRFTRMPLPPPAVEVLLARAPAGSWDRVRFVTDELLDRVVAVGAGTPVSVPPERVEDMLAGTREGTPFEIAAAHAMLARWAGIPARMAFGFDGGDEVADGVREVRPRHGVTFVELYFPGYKWVPLLAAPRRAKATTSSDEQRFDPNVIPSEDIGVVLYLPTATPPPSVLAANVARIAGLVAALLVILALFYVTLPVPRKARARARRRAWAAAAGPEARIAAAYADWRDLAADLGYHHPADTPLAFVERVMDDREHEVLAWLVTRTLWGDLGRRVETQDAVNAEELVRSLKRRLSQALPWTIRAVGAMSRVSLREPFLEPGRVPEREAA